MGDTGKGLAVCWKKAEMKAAICAPPPALLLLPDITPAGKSAAGYLTLQFLCNDLGSQSTRICRRHELVRRQLLCVLRSLLAVLGSRRKLVETRVILNRPSMKFVKSGRLVVEVFGSRGRNKSKSRYDIRLGRREIIKCKERIKNKPWK